MREYHQALKEVKEGSSEVIDINQYYQEHQKELDRYEIKEGKVSYDFAQLDQAIDIARSAGAIFKGTLGVNAMSARSWQNNPRLKNLKNNETLLKHIEESQKYATSMIDVSKEIKNTMRERIEWEVSPTQKFVESMGTEMFRQVTDVRQIPILYLSNLLGGAAAAKFGVQSFLGQRLISMGISGVSEGAEELLDRTVTGEDYTAEDILYAAGGGALAGGLVLPAIGFTAKKAFQFGTDPKLKLKISELYNVSKSSVYKKMGKSAGDIRPVNFDITQEVIENLRPINGIAGKPGMENNIFKKSVTIDGKKVPEMKNYAAEVINIFINRKDIEFIKTGADFNNVLERSPETIFNLAKIMQDDGSLTPGQKEAVNYFIDLANNKRIPDIDIDMKAVNEEIVNNLTNPSRGYDPIFEEVHPLRYIDVDEATLKAREKNIKHNYGDFKKGVLEYNLRNDKIIPEGAEVIYARGKIHKDKVPIKTGTDIEGKPVFTRNKWLKKDAEITVKYKYDGDIYYGDLILNQKGEYIGDIYKTSNNPLNSHKTKIVKPENIMEDLHGRYNVDQEINISKKDIENIIKRKLNLDEGVEKLSKEKLYKRFIETVKEVGKTVKKKYNLNTVDDVVNFYKKKYDLNFKLQKAELQGGRMAELEINMVNGKPDYTLRVSSSIADTDLEMGAVRHEIQHIIDSKKNPDFISDPTKKVKATANSTAKDILEQANTNHFAGHEGDWWEYSYLVANEMDNLVKDGKLNKEAAKILGLDLPKEIDLGDIKMLQRIVETGKNEKDIAKRLKNLKTQSNNRFSYKESLKDIYYSGMTSSQKATAGKEASRTHILLPLQKAEEQMQNELLKSFEIKIDGNIMNPQKVLDMFEDKNSSFIDFIFYDGKLNKDLEKYTPELLELKGKIRKIIDNLQESSVVTADDIMNTLAYDRNFSIEKLLKDSEISKYLDDGKGFDSEKFLNGKQIEDTLTGRAIPERVIPIREAFSETNYKYFNSAIDRLEHEIIRENVIPERIAKAIIEAKDCMTPEELKNIISKHNLDILYPEVQKVINDNPDLFNLKIKNNIDYEANIIASKKKNAALFFTDDMMSIKGTEKNPALGTFAHKISRFVDAEYEGYIFHKNVSEFVRNNKCNDRLIVNKIVRDISAAHAIKETFPGGGMNGLNQLLNEIQKETINPHTKTFTKEIKSFLRDELGEKLGLITKPSRGEIDRFVDRFIKWQNKINLTGLKAFRELGQEPIGMARANVMLYGGEGYINTYSYIMKATAIIMENGDQLAEINKSLGSKWKDSIPIEFFNIIQEDLGDFTGYRNYRLEKYGSQFDKTMAKLDKGVQAVNLYGNTQRIMKLAAHFLAGEDLNNITKYNSLEDLFKNSTNHIKRTFKDLQITEAEYTLLKEFKNTNSFKKNNIFDEVDFSDSLTKEKFDKASGRTLLDGEYDILKENLVKKATKLYDKVVSDVSPTETTGSQRAVIDNIENPIHRNFQRLMGNFKVSIQEQWRRMLRDFYLSNLVEETGKFDWSNKIYQKRLLSHTLGTGAFLATTSVVTDLDFYSDPIETISERVDKLIEEPGSILWQSIQDQFNLWGLTTGANTVRRPVQIMNNISKGDVDKATENIIKLGIGSYNYNQAKWIKENVLD